MERGTDPPTGGVCLSICCELVEVTRRERMFIVAFVFGVNRAGAEASEIEMSGRMANPSESDRKTVESLVWGECHKTGRQRLSHQRRDEPFEQAVHVD